MSQSRIEAFTSMVRDQPDNEMIWYGLANEYFKLEQWGEAVEAWRQVIRIKPDYTSAYQLLGTALMNEGQREEARRVWAEGIEVATRTGAWKARQHMAGLLAGTSTDSGPGLCAEK